MSSTTSFKATSADWDRTSSHYSTIVVASQGPMAKPTERMLALLDSHAPMSQATTILDSGCGPGTATSQLINTYSSTINRDAQILAGDFSTGMVCQISQLRKTKLAELPIGPERDLWSRLTPFVLDVTDCVALIDESVSHIVASFVFPLTGNPKKALTEACRMLTPQGVLVCSSWALVSWIDLIVEAAKCTFASLNRSVPRAPELPIQWRSTKAIVQQFFDAGFKDAKAEYVDTAMMVPDPEAWAKSFIRSGNPAVTWLTDHLDDTGQTELERQLAKLVCERCEKNEQGAYRIVGTAVVAVGMK